jgi:hypothetical protein
MRWQPTICGYTHKGLAGLHLTSLQVVKGWFNKLAGLSFQNLIFKLAKSSRG